MRKKAEILTPKKILKAEKGIIDFFISIDEKKFKATERKKWGEKKVDYTPSIYRRKNLIRGEKCL